MSDATLAIIIAVIAGPAGALLVAWLKRGSDRANITKLITEATGDLIEDYRKQADELHRDVAVLRAESKALAAALENLKAQVLKYRLALVVTVIQLRMAGFEPLIDPAEIDTMSVEDLRLVAEGASNAAARSATRGG